MKDFIETAVAWVLSKLLKPFTKGWNINSREEVKALLLQAGRQLLMLLAILLLWAGILAAPWCCQALCSEQVTCIQVTEDTATFERYSGHQYIWELEPADRFEEGETYKASFFDFEDSDPRNDYIIWVK